MSGHIRLRIALFGALAIGFRSLPRTVLAADPTDAAEQGGVDERYKRHMGLGIRLYEDRSFDAAQIEFERAYATRAGAGPLINIALCHKGRAEYVKAARVLERAIAAHGGETDQREAMDLALRELRELIAVVELEVEPLAVGAKIFVDGEEQPAATGPALEVSPGIHSLEVSAPGFFRYREELKLGAGDRRRLPVKLIPDSGTLSIDVSGLPATIRIDGAVDSGRPFRRLLKAGTHFVTLEREKIRYTAGVSVVAASETRLRLDASGLLYVGDAAPRGPDEVERPPISGGYFLAGFSTGGRVGQRSGLASTELSSVIFYLGPDVHAGYRVTRNIGVEGYVRQLFSDSGQAPNSVTQMGVGVRVMTNHEPAYFSLTGGTGFALETPTLRGTSLPAFHAVAEPRIAGEAGHFLWGFGTPVTVMVGAYPVNVELSGRLELGYGSW